MKLAKVVGFEPTITVLETVALVQAKLHQHWRRIKESNHQPFGAAVFKTVCPPWTVSSILVTIYTIGRADEIRTRIAQIESLGS
jgi:hypothetical protein